MNEDQSSTSVIDAIAQFAMRQTSRRGFFRWVGKAGLALAATTGSIAFFSSNALAYYDCSKYLPGCTGACTCGTSQCQDPDDGKHGCSGDCSECPERDVEMTIFYYWEPSLNKCVQVIDCAPCVV